MEDSQQVVPRHAILSMRETSTQADSTPVIAMAVSSRLVRKFPSAINQLRPKISRQECFLLSTIFVVAVAIRSIGMTWGLPEQNNVLSAYLVDEPAILGSMLRLGDGVYDARLHVYPVFYYLGFLLFAGHYSIGRLLGHYADWPDFLAVHVQDISQLLLLGRLLIVLTAGFTVVITYFVGRDLFSRRAGYISAVFVLFSFGHVVYSKVFRLDSFLPLPFLLAIYLIARLVGTENERLRPYVLCGLAVGLTMATKVTGFAVLVPFLAIPFLAPRGVRVAAPWKLKFDKRFAFGLVVAGGTYVALAAPGLLSLATVIQRIANRLDKSGQFGNPSTLSPDKFSLSWHVTRILPAELGATVYPLAIAGLAILLLRARKHRAAIPILLAIAAYLIPIGYAIRTTWRDMLPLLPLLAVCAGFFLDRALQYVYARLPAHVNQRRQVLASSIAVLVLVALPIYNIYRQKALILSKDTREIAAEWIEAELPEGSAIAMEAYGPGILDAERQLALRTFVQANGRDREVRAVDRPLYVIRSLNWELNTETDHELVPAQLLTFLEASNTEYVIVSSGYYGRFFNEAVDAHYPEIGERGREFHDLVETALQPIYEDVPNWSDKPGPVIKIYRVPAVLDSSMQAKTGSFDPYPGMERPASAVGYYQFSPH